MFFQMGWFNHQLYSLPSLKAWEQKKQKITNTPFSADPEAAYALGFNLCWTLWIQSVEFRSPV